MAEHALIVDDEPNMRWVLKEALEGAGYTARVAASGPEALALLAHAAADLVILDLKMKEMDGLSVLQRIRERFPDTVVILLTAYGTVATAVQAMHLGAADVVRKPFDVEDILFKIQRALERRRLQHELAQLQRHQRASIAFDQLIGVDHQWHLACEQIMMVGDADLCLWGEGGSGRASLGRAAHHLSSRQTAPLLEVDLRTLPATAQHGMLLGLDGDEGLWQRAGQGTLLLRAVEVLDSPVWEPLLVALRTCIQRRTGPRLILTAHAPLAALHAELFSHVAVPPLRARRGDLALFLAAWLPAHSLTPAAQQLLDQYAWPGNVAELRAVLARAQRLTTTDLITEHHLPTQLRALTVHDETIQLPPQGIDLETVERELIRQALQRAHGNKTRAAELLGLTRHTLIYRLDKFGLSYPDDEAATL